MTTHEDTPWPAAPEAERYAIMVDVGYLYAAYGALLLGTTSRREFRVEADKLILGLLTRARKRVGANLLRIYWYDAARDRVPTVEQRVIGAIPRVKVRLGNLNAAGQQKGVDAAIRDDMERLSRQRAVSDLILVSGDEDMVRGVEEAQAHGVVVHLWGVEPPFGSNQSARLAWECDTVEILGREFAAPWFTQPQWVTGRQAAPAAPAAAAVPAAGAAAGPAPARLPGQDGPAAPSPAQVFGQLSRPAPRPVLPPAPSGPDRLGVEEVGEHVAQRWILVRGEDNIRELLPGPVLPAVIDKELLEEAEKELGLSLRPYQHAREWLRGAFWARVYREFGISLGESQS